MRLVDALVLPDRETRIAARGEPIHLAEGERAVLVQTKDSRLGMYLMGQTLFSAELLRRRFPTAAIESIALCTQDDDVLVAFQERSYIESKTDVAAFVIAGHLSVDPDARAVIDCSEMQD